MDNHLHSSLNKFNILYNMQGLGINSIYDFQQELGKR